MSMHLEGSLNLMKILRSRTLRFCFILFVYSRTGLMQVFHYGLVLFLFFCLFVISWVLMGSLLSCRCTYMCNNLQVCFRCEVKCRLAFTFVNAQEFEGRTSRDWILLRCSWSAYLTQRFLQCYDLCFFFFRLCACCCNDNLSSVVLFSFNNFTEPCISYEIIFLMVGS